MKLYRAAQRFINLVDKDYFFTNEPSAAAGYTHYCLWRKALKRFYFNANQIQTSNHTLDQAETASLSLHIFFQVLLLQKSVFVLVTIYLQFLKTPMPYSPRAKDETRRICTNFPVSISTTLHIKVPYQEVFLWSIQLLLYSTYSCLF